MVKSITVSGLLSNRQKLADKIYPYQKMEKIRSVFGADFLSHRNDGKIFTKRNRPNDEISLAVGVLVNMSGSMYGERIKTAQAMTLIVYDFCRTLNIPVTIYGHDTFSDTVNLYSFAEFDSLDGNDKFRLMNITDGGQRDAAPMLVFFQFIKGISF